MFNPVNVQALSEYRIWVRYTDGTEGPVDLSSLAGRGVFALWDDDSAFENVHLADDGAIRWTDEVELCPDAVYLKLTGQDPEDVFPNVQPATPA